MLSEQAKKCCEDNGIDWRELLQKYGPVLVQLIVDLLTGLAPRMAAARKHHDDGDCVPCCHRECIDATISNLVAALAHQVHLCNCCEDPPRV